MTYRMVIDRAVIEEYEDTVYFKQHPRAKKKPFKAPHHPSLNEWGRMSNLAHNNHKQKWGDFIEWLVRKYGYNEKYLDKVDIWFYIYMPTKRRCDPDNMSPKFIMDGLVKAGLLVDDDGDHVKKLILSTGHDKDNPRTEITITTYD